MSQVVLTGRPHRSGSRAQIGEAMDVIPVLDLMEGRVVRGVGGRRETYAPLQSPLAPSSNPLDVARVFRDRLGLNRLYVADLDAIMSDRPQWPILANLAAEGFQLLVDAGLRSAESAGRLLELGVSQIIAALETLTGPGALSEILSRVGPDRVVFSLDLREGRPLGDIGGWESDDPGIIAHRAIELGVTSLIVLDLTTVGRNTGAVTGALCRRIRGEHPHVTLITGGGVRSASDLRELSRCGVDAALVSSALHAGTIGPEEIAAVRHRCD